MEKTKAQTKFPAEMSEKLAWLKALMRSKDLTAGAKNVATALFMCHNAKTGRCNPTQDYLAEATGMYRPAVNTGIKQLHAGGWIASVKTRGASYYRLNVALGEVVSGIEVSADRYSNDNVRCPPIDTADVRESIQQESANRYKEPSSLTVQEEPSIFPVPTADAVEAETDTVVSPDGKVKKRQDRKASKQPSRTELPRDWEPGDLEKALARQEGVPETKIAEVAKRFMAHHWGEGTTSPNWAAKWQSWCLGHIEREQRNAARNQPKPNLRANPLAGMKGYSRHQLHSQNPSFPGADSKAS